MAIPIIFVNYILLNILVAADRQKINAIVTGICLFVNISLNMCLIPYYGYLGAGYATVVTEIVLFAMGWYFATKYICKVNIVAVFSKPFISVAIMGTFIVLATARLNLAFVIVLSALTYFTCLLLFRFFTKDDKVYKIENGKLLFQGSNQLTWNQIREAKFSIDGFTFEGTFSCITCEVHSSLDAVGMTAAMTTALTDKGISANVVAGFYHDHIFVPCQRADEAVMVLSSLSH